MFTADASGADVQAVYRVKARALAVILVFYWAIELFVSPFGQGTGMTLVVLATLLGTLTVLWGPRRHESLLLRFSLAVDVLAVSAGVHLAGGVDNVSMPLLYPAVISLAGLLLTPADAFAIAILAALTYDGVVIAEYAEALPHLVAYSRPPDRQLATALPINVFLILYAWLVSFAVARMRALHQRSEQVRREAMGALSHDLKNPLSVIHGYARMMEEAPEDERRRFGRGIERTAQQALDLVSNVLDAAAFDGNPLTPRVHAVHLGALVGDVADRYRFAAEAASITLAVQPGDEVPIVHADGQLLARAIGNLIANAIKYTPPGGRVEVATFLDEAGAVVRVSDNGRGIAASEVGVLFRAYSRASSAQGVEGTGLGLYIVRCVAEAHGGTATVESKPGEGSAFSITLPVSGDLLAS